MINQLKKILISAALFASSASFAAVNFIDFAPGFPKEFSFMFCQIIVTKSDISDRIIKRERVNTLDIQIDDYEQDRKISWNTDTFVDGYNAGYAGARKICQSTGFVWQSQIIGLIWSDIEASWESQFVSCLKAGLRHKGYIYYKEKQADPLTKYFSPYHPVFTEINKTCGELTRVKLEKDYKCTTNLGASICNDRLMVMRNGKPNLISLNEAVVAKLNGEEVGTVGQETEKGVTERLARENEVRQKKVEAEKRQAWLASAEGKKYLADEEAKRINAEQNRIQAEAADNARIAKEYPYVARFTCTTNGIAVNFISCLYGRVNTEIEIQNGQEYKLYQGAEFSNEFPDDNGAKVVNLRSKFSITAQNAANNLILGVKILDRKSGVVVFEKQASQFRVIKVGN